MKPLFKYPGGKGRELKNIRNFYPKKRVKIFAEPFVGAGAVFWDFDDADEFYINDISKELTNIYEYTKKKNALFFSTLDDIVVDWDGITLQKKLTNKFSLEKYNWFLNRKLEKGMNKDDAIMTSLKSAYFVSIRDKYNVEKKQEVKSALYLFIMTYAFSSLFQYNLKGELNIPYGGYGYNNKKFSNVIERLRSEEVIDKLSRTHIFNEDFETFMNRLEGKDAYIFIDPPYVSDMIYNGVKFTSEDQARLVEIIKKSPTSLSVIGDDPLIRKIYTKEHFVIEEFDINFSMTYKMRNITKKKNLYIIKK